MSTYNGWTNYETWCVNLWLTNDQGSDEELRRIAQSARDEHRAADAIKDWVEEMMPDLGASLWSDMLSAALSEVDWAEIAEGAREGMDDDEAEAEEEEADA